MKECKNGKKYKNNITKPSRDVLTKLIINIKYLHKFVDEIETKILVYFNLASFNLYQGIIKI